MCRAHFLWVLKPQMINAFQSRAFRRIKGVGWNRSVRAHALRARPREGEEGNVTGNEHEFQIQYILYVYTVY